MLDIKLIRSNPDLVRSALAKRGDDPAKVDRLMALDGEFRQLQQQLDNLRQERNDRSKQIGAIKTERAMGDVVALQEVVAEIAKQIKALEQQVSTIESERKNPRTGLLFQIPNIPDESVPLGLAESANVEIRRWGTLPSNGFIWLPHEEIGANLGILDMNRAAKLAGTRFVVLKGIGARLERALGNFMLDLHVANGYTEVLPPAIANEETLTANGNLPKFQDQLFKLEGLPYYLIPTAEVPLTNLYREEILEADKLPLYLTAYTPCFRSEAGAAGKDTKGMIRVHQFGKVELVKIVHPDNSFAELEAMVEDAERVLQALELPYRVMLLATGDLGFNSAKTYDLEVWFPSQGKYREISSCSNCTDFQARRGQTRFRENSTLRFPHTLNGSGVAIGRTLAAILENGQRADGTIKLPAALWPYLGGLREIRKE
ncbi:MAG: serine--tRNA ligase [Cyanobacteria bacterium NC_groundwater_1444_Ag_S-0.65um_54_12]|nr:serine--tRNA ligase [Cyanobacteria bacterium NC_groundwater_1444_Ag_S-0.65um_54_12]